MRCVSELESRGTRQVVARRTVRLGLMCAAVATVAAVACGGGSASQPASTAASPAPPQSAAPVAGDVATTTFSPRLEIDLSKMYRRPSGLYVQDMTQGNGAVALSGRTAVVKYAGYFPDGRSFDSGEITITLGQNKVIRAWEDGVLGMRVGGTRRLVTPPHLAYGARGNPPTIPPNAVLVFDMQLSAVY